VMYPLINAVWMLSYARIADFAQFAPRTNRLAQLAAVFFILEIPLWLIPGTLGQTINFALIIFAAYPLLFTGCWIAWRRGNSAAGILLLSNIMLFTFWGPYQLNELWPTPLFASLIGSGSLSSVLGVTSDLALPLLFCIALAARTLNLKQAALRLMSYDALTGLPNREMIRRAGEELLKRGQSFAVLVLNIDRFRAINGALGPEIGDQLLVVAGNRLAAIEGAKVGRLHADQFCLLWTDISRLKALRERIENDFLHPIDEHGQMVDLALSIGMVRVANAEFSMAQLLRRAEIALEAGRAQHEHWMEYSVDFEAGRRADLGLLSELSRAIEEGELRMFLQPKVRLEDGCVVSAEALVRWQHPVRGLVGPFEFVPFAEQTGRICLITQWMFVSAMKLCAQMRAAGTPLQISVNVSALDLNQNGFVANLQKLSQELAALPGDIRLEVTESAAMHDPTAALEIMHTLKNAGFSLSIDDFGTGYSSLSYLQKMPVAELKIDRSFVRDVVAESDAAVLLESTVEMAHRLGLSVVAEGAETALEWALLVQLKCDYVQGYFAAKPMPVDDFLRWRANHSPFIPLLGSCEN
jgi:diguanylate cyclase (GGDEF)-like protein